MLELLRTKIVPDNCDGDDAAREASNKVSEYLWNAVDRVPEETEADDAKIMTDLIHAE